MDFFKKAVGGGQKPLAAEDADFADFAAAPDPSPISIPASPADAAAASPTGPIGRGRVVPYTKWYRVWERTQPSDFYLEMTLVPFILLALLVHFWGTSTNKKKARKWMAVHQPVLESEFALVGYHRAPKATPYAEGTQGDSLLEAAAKLDGTNLADDLLKEQTASEFQTYASGRVNAAFLDVRVLLHRRMNPAQLIAEQLVGLFLDSVKPKKERMEAALYTFDGNEKNFVPPRVPGADEVEKAKGTGNSAYDPFVFAIVNKLEMRKFRDERYDASLTFTKDNPKLPDWVTVMSESAEITDTLLTKDLIAAVERAGDLFEYLIVTDQPTDKPNTIEETSQKKRIHMCVRLPGNGDYRSTLPLFQAFLRLPDFLVANAHFRPEVMKKINTAREGEKSKLKKVSDKAAEEERLLQLEKMKKDERDRKLKGMSAEEQRKFLEREAEKNRKKQEKKMQRRG